jgi:hypothetical protein
MLNSLIFIRAKLRIPYLSFHFSWFHHEVIMIDKNRQIFFYSCMNYVGFVSVGTNSMTLLPSRVF